MLGPGYSTAFAGNYSGEKAINTASAKDSRGQNEISNQDQLFPFTALSCCCAKHNVNSLQMLLLKILQPSQKNVIVQSTEKEELIDIFVLKISKCGGKRFFWMLEVFGL